MAPQDLPDLGPCYSRFEECIKKAAELRDQERRARSGRYNRYMEAVTKLEPLAGYSKPKCNAEGSGSRPDAASGLDFPDHELAQQLALGQYEWIEAVTAEEGQGQGMDVQFQGKYNWSPSHVLLELRDCLAERDAPKDGRPALLIAAAIMWWRWYVSQVLPQAGLHLGL